MTLEAPFARHNDVVRPEWIDYSGHMNMGFYLPAFEQAAICFFAVVDISEDYRMRSGNALFVTETHVTYERELLAGAGLRFESQILDASDKAIDCMHFRLHAFHVRGRGRLSGGDQPSLVPAHRPRNPPRRALPRRCPSPH
jgi:acyl-CoA thioester hydrolase